MFPMRRKEKVWIWIGGEVGKIWEELEKEKTINRIYCAKKNPFSNKKKKVCLKKSEPDNDDGKGEQVRGRQHFRWLNTLDRTGEQRS